MDMIADPYDPHFEPVYTIGHAAQKLNVAVPTLRMYEHSGLLLPHRTPTNRRFYSRHDVEQIKIIMDLIREQHPNIETIKHLAALIPCWEFSNCPIEIRKECSACYDSSKPCWLQPFTRKCGKSNDSCRTCEVYRSYPQILKNPKNLLKIGITKEVSW